MQAIRKRWPAALAALCAMVLLGACEGIFTGTAAGSILLEVDAGGGFNPVALKLTTDMSPVSLNFHADLGNNPHETGKWNGYQASLSRNGRVVASRPFNVSYTGTIDLPPAHPAQVITMLIQRVEESGEYTLSIKSLKAAEVSLQNTRVEVRRNVQVPK